LNRKDGWDPRQYLKFASERTRPCHDLAGHVSLSDVRRVIDLGCGPGNSTEVLVSRWPRAEVAGLDNSAGMIETARQSHPDRRWILQGIADWAATADEQFDLVFSNAALQWVGDHDVLFPRLLERVVPGGALAVQMPCGFNTPGQRLMHELATSPPWVHKFPSEGVRQWHVRDIDFYYDLLAPRTVALDCWKTDYLHILPNAEAIVEWYKGTALRPFLDALESAADKEQFTSEYLELIRPYYPPHPDGRVLLPFPRMFLIAYR